MSKKLKKSNPSQRKAKRKAVRETETGKIIHKTRAERREEEDLATKYADFLKDRMSKR